MDIDMDVDMGDDEEYAALEAEAMRMVCLIEIALLFISPSGFGLN